MQSHGMGVQLVKGVAFLNIKEGGSLVMKTSLYMEQGGTLRATLKSRCRAFTG